MTAPPDDRTGEQGAVQVSLGPGLRQGDGGLTIVMKLEQSLFHAIAAQNRNWITGLCGGCCICGTCRVRVLAGDPGQMGTAEAHLRRQLSITDPAIRLSCQMRPARSLHIEIIQPE